MERNLETELGAAQARIRELELEQEWINAVGKPKHPDDERPWLPAYLDARRRVLKLVDEIMTAQALLADGHGDLAIEQIIMIELSHEERAMVNGWRGTPNLQEGGIDGQDRD